MNTISSAIRNDVSTRIDFAMFSPAGNAAVNSMLRRVIVAFRRGMAEGELVALFMREREQIETVHSEVTDTAVREVVWKALDEAGICESIITSALAH